MQCSGTPVIDAREVCARYGRESVWRLDHVSARISSGVTALVGKNGAGKTTLMKALVGLTRVQQGSLEVLGIDIARERLDHGLLGRVGYLSQDFGYVPSFTVREFIEYGAWLKRVPGAQISERAAAAIVSVGLTDSARTKMRKLSGGMRRRAGIAQALVHDPDLLILDEPTTGLDPEQRVRFRELIRNLAENRTVLLSSHLIEDVRALAEQVLILDEGRLIFDGTIAELEQRGSGTEAGDSPLERGYLHLLAREEAKR